LALTAQEKLPGQLRAALTEVLPLKLLSHLCDNLIPLRTDVIASQESQKQHHHEMADKLSEHYAGLSSDIQALKEDLRNSTVVQQRIESCLSSTSCPRSLGPPNGPSHKQIGFGVTIDNRQQGWTIATDSDANVWQPDGRESQAWYQINAIEQMAENVCQESLRDV
jgi:hypothetical protein